MVYKLQCSDCSGVYIEETSQLLKSRLYQHTYNVQCNLENKTNGISARSILLLHPITLWNFCIILIFKMLLYEEIGGMK